MKQTHSFHIPVMGIGFTLDSPLKVAQYGIDSVISLVDDILIEKIRKVYSEKLEIPYQEITNKMEDFRAKRITSYLNLVNDQVTQKFTALKNATAEKSEELMTYIDMLPKQSNLKKEFNELISTGFDFSKVKEWISNNLTMGSIDVNIMTKLDRENYVKNEQLPVEFNDAHSALRGFANSDLRSSIILSAGMNPRLYAYMSQFDDFFPNAEGVIKKKIILKVSDYRSALIQGKFLAKKGLWVSEYRIESGLNCGGHAFATDGFLLGPVLEEFKTNKIELVKSTQELLNQTLISMERIVPKKELSIAITAQGGVGTEEEHDFLLDYYKMDSVGWGTPFLLVPEATTVDDETLTKLAKAKEADLYLSDVSPLGVPFNNLRGNTKDAEKELKIANNRPGSTCPKQYIALSKDIKESGTCTASREYQRVKINELESQNLSTNEFEKAYHKITDKSCICVGLGTSALIVNDVDTKAEGPGIAVCPGPNMAYYSQVMSLKNITDHIYGRDKMVSRLDRPNMFIKELNIYIDFLQGKLDEAKTAMDIKQKRYLTKFVKNMNQGVLYYENLFSELKETFEETKTTIFAELEKSTKKLQLIGLEVEAIAIP